jgi:hypoxanthine-DNA glycosylase
LDNLVIHTLDPIYNKDSKVLILGTMPSPKSREFNFYYSHPQNRFWKVISHIFSEPTPTTNEEKTQFLYRNNIALWDVLKSCTITGADDSSIKNPVVNDFTDILKTADIKAIFTTGKKATDLYLKYCLKYTNIEPIALPSTSPANRRFSFEILVEEYVVILGYVK